MISGIKYFLSGAHGLSPDTLKKSIEYIDYRLLSVHRTFKTNNKLWYALTHEKNSAMKEVMLDSGAFTAFMRGHKTTLPEVIDAYDEAVRLINPKCQLWFINLDVIPGKAAIKKKVIGPDGKKKDVIDQEMQIAEGSEMQRAVDESDDNFKKLRKRYGDRVLPVFHQTESPERFRHVLGMADFIGCGFRQDFADTVRLSFAEEVIVRRDRYSPKTRIHGLATTSYEMMTRVKFDTLDSATWLYVAAMGQILVMLPRSYMIDGKLTEHLEWKKLAVSNESPNKRDPRSHIENMTEEERAAVIKQIEEVGSTLAQVQSSSAHRILVSAYTTQNWMTHLVNERKVVTIADEGFFE